MIELPTQHVSRVFILPVTTFDYLKRYQRALVARTGRDYNNSQVLSQILAEHKAHVGITGKAISAPVAALLTQRGDQQ